MRPQNSEKELNAPGKAKKGETGCVWVLEGKTAVETG